MTKHRKAPKNAALPLSPKHTAGQPLLSLGSRHTSLRAVSRTQQPQSLCTFCSQCLKGSLSRSPHGGRTPIPPFLSISAQMSLLREAPPALLCLTLIPWTLCPSVCFLTVPLPLDSEPQEERVLVCLVQQHIPRAWYRVLAQQE